MFLCLVLLGSLNRMSYEWSLECENVQSRRVVNNSELVLQNACWNKQKHCTTLKQHKKSAEYNNAVSHPLRIVLKDHKWPRLTKNV